MSYYRVRVCCGNVFTDPLPSNGYIHHSWYLVFPVFRRFLVVLCCLVMAWNDCVVFKVYILFDMVLCDSRGRWVVTEIFKERVMKAGLLVNCSQNVSRSSTHYWTQSWCVIFPQQNININVFKGKSDYISCKMERMRYSILINFALQ
jgi:hypothetical protein